MSDGLNLVERLTPKRGRDSRSESMATRFTKPELATLSQAATADGKTVREWSREVLLQAAATRKDDALFTELVATRMLLVNLIKPIITGQKVSEDWISQAQAMVRQSKRKAAAEVRQQYHGTPGVE